MQIFDLKNAFFFIFPIFSPITPKIVKKSEALPHPKLDFNIVFINKIAAFYTHSLYKFITSHTEMIGM